VPARAVLRWAPPAPSQFPIENLHVSLNPLPMPGTIVVLRVAEDIYYSLRVEFVVHDCTPVRLMQDPIHVVYVYVRMLEDAESIGGAVDEKTMDARAADFIREHVRRDADSLSAPSSSATRVAALGLPFCQT